MSDLLTIDRQVFVDSYGQRPFPVSHRLTDHPLLALEALGELPDFLPEERVEHNRADLPDILPSGEAARLEATPGEIARGDKAKASLMRAAHKMRGTGMD